MTEEQKQELEMDKLQLLIEKKSFLNLLNAFAVWNPLAASLCHSLMHWPRLPSSIIAEQKGDLITMTCSQQVSYMPSFC